MNLGEGPQFIAIEVNLAMANKLKNSLVVKFYLSNDFFKPVSQDPSQRYIVFHLAGSIYPQDVANIHEVCASDSISDLSSSFDNVYSLGRFWIVLMERLLNFVTLLKK